MMVLTKGLPLCNQSVSGPWTLHTFHQPLLAHLLDADGDTRMHDPAIGREPETGNPEPQTSNSRAGGSNGRAEEEDWLRFSAANGSARQESPAVSPESPKPWLSLIGMLV